LTDLTTLNEKDYRKVDKRVRPGADEMDVEAAASRLHPPSGRPAVRRSWHLDRF